MKTLNLNIPGFTIACKIWGNPQNPPIVAVHGWLDNANSFDYIAQTLQNQFYIIAVDLPGHGHSSHLPAGCYYHFTDGIFTLIEILNALNFDKVHLLGHSMGACLGSLLAGVAPERLLSLSLIEGLGPLTHPAQTACKQLTNFSRYLATEKKSHKGFPEMELAAFVRSNKGYVSFDIARTLIERGIHLKNGTYHWTHDHRLKTPSPLRMTEEQVLSCLRKIESKTLLVCASKGFSFNAQQMQKRIQAVKQIKIERIDGGHHIHMEQPEVVSQLLADFYLSI